MSADLTSNAGIPELERHNRSATLSGVAAIVLWSSSIAVMRSLTEALGPILYVVLVFGLAGLVGLLRYGMNRQAWQDIRGLPWSYLAIGGGLFVVYQAALCLAVGLATERSQVLVVGVINYLWPVLMLVLALPIQGWRARGTLGPGIALAVLGLLLATGPELQQLFVLGTPGSPGSLRSLGVYSLALLAAVTWGLYSNLGRRLAGKARGNPVPLFMLTSSLLLLPVYLILHTPITWSLRVGLEMAFAALLPGLAAYGLWDRGVRTGNLVLLSVMSFFIPFLSTLISSFYLGLWPGWNLWVACGLLVSGALVSYRSVSPGPPT